MTKRILSIITILLLSATITACGNNDDRISELEKEVKELKEENEYIKTQISSMQGKETSEQNNLQNQTEIIESYVEQEQGESSTVNGVFIEIGENHYSVNTDTGRFEISFKEDVKMSVDDKKLEAYFENEILKYHCVCEIDEMITNAPDCERKINAITDEIRNENTVDGYFGLIGQGEYLPNYGIDITNNSNILAVDKQLLGSSYMYSDLKDVDEYYSEYTLSNVRCESYNCSDGITIHAYEESLYYNYIDIYNSFDTEIEKMQFKNDYYHSNFPLVKIHFYAYDGTFHDNISHINLTNDLIQSKNNKIE